MDLENNNIKSIDMIAKFSNFEIINSEFTRARCNVFYTGRNRNYSDITQDALDKFIERKGYANVPVVAHLIKREDGSYAVGGHDEKIVLTNESIEIVDETVPFGVIPEDCNPSMELVTERSGEKRQYFSVDIILWTHRYPILEAAYSDEIYFNQSMELNFLDYDYDGEYVVVNDFSMSALCLLNRSMNSEENVEPCFESSVVRKFSVDEEQFKQNFELLLETIKQYEADSTASIQNINNNNLTSMKGDQSMELSKFAEVLSTVKIEGKDEPQYALLQTNDTQLYVLDMEDYKPYSLDYAITVEDEVENIVIDFDSKVEMSLSASEKITDENFAEFDMLATIEAKAEAKVEEYTELLNQKYNALEEQYQELLSNYETATQRIKEYELIEKEAKKAEHEEAVGAIFNKYADKLRNCAEFLVYKAKLNPEDITLEELEQKLTLMAGKYMMNNATKSNFSYTPNVSEVNNANIGKSNSGSSRYGNLLDNYMN